MNRKMRIVLMSAALAVVSWTQAMAAPIGGQNWADSVTDYSSNIQNYGGAMMDANTTWWLSGPSDADVDDNGYGWDANDNDYVAGWRGGAPNEYIVVYFVTGLEDRTGDDLVIHAYEGPQASARVLASTDGNEFVEVGTIRGGTPGYFRDEGFDFARKFASDVH